MPPLQNFFSTTSSRSGGAVHEIPETVPTPLGYSLHPAKTKKIFETMIPRLERMIIDASSPTKELLVANLTLLKQMQRSYEAYDSARKSDPYVHRFNEELMKDIEQQLFENVVGRIRIEVVCLRNARRSSSFLLSVKHADFEGAVNLRSMNNRNWNAQYFVGGAKKTFIEVRANPLRPIELALFRRGLLRSLKCSASQLGEKVFWETSDLLGVRSFHDVAFGEISARVMVTWLPYVWGRERRPNAGNLRTKKT